MSLAIKCLTKTNGITYWTFQVFHLCAQQLWHMLFLADLNTNGTELFYNSSQTFNRNGLDERLLNNVIETEPKPSQKSNRITGRTKQGWNSEAKIIFNLIITPASICGN